MQVNFDSGSFLKASDVPQPITVTIAGATRETLGDENKVVARFQELTPRLPLNKINGNTIISFYGEETDYWIGRQVELYATTCEMKGAIVPCIRIRAPQQQQPAPQQQPQFVQPAVQPPAPQPVVPQQQFVPQAAVQPPAPQQQFAPPPAAQPPANGAYSQPTPPPPSVQAPPSDVPYDA